jgi:tetratricopeptide (TPR) repeat protein
MGTVVSEADELLEQALSLGDEGRWDEMATLLARALEGEPDDAYLLCWLGVAERELGNDGAAYEYFKRALAEDPLDPQLLALAGAGLAAFDDPDAERVLRTAALSGPDIPFARLQYGAYLAREGFFEEALENLRAAVALAPDDASMHGELGIALALKGDLPGAASIMEDTLALAPDDSWTRVLLGLVLLELGRIDTAAETLLQASAERPEDGEAQVVAALAAAAAGWPDAAEEPLARAPYATEPVDSVLLEEVETRIAEGEAPARTMLVETLAPSLLHERLLQPL